MRAVDWAHPSHGKKWEQQIEPIPHLERNVSNRLSPSLAWREMRAVDWGHPSHRESLCLLNCQIELYKYVYINTYLGLIFMFLWLACELTSQLYIYITYVKCSLLNSGSDKSKFPLIQTDDDCWARYYMHWLVNSSLHLQSDL